MANHEHHRNGPTDCFGCKVKSIGLTLGAVGGVLQGPDGRKKFHGPTIGERRERMIAEAKHRGNEPVELTRRERAEFRGTV